MPSVFTETLQATFNPLNDLWREIVLVVPELLGAIIVLIIGAFIAVILGHALRIVLEKTPLDKAVKKAKLTKAIGHTNVSSLLGELLKWYIIIIFLGAAVDLVHLGPLSDLLTRFVLWLPNLLVAFVVMLVGLIVSHFVEMKVMEHTNVKGMQASATALKWILIVVFALIAVRQIGVDVSLLENTFLIVVGTLSAGVALALGIGLGLGLKRQGEDFVKKIQKKI